MNKFLKVISLILVFTFTFLSFAIYSFAGSKIEEGVSLLDPRKNIHGNGYEWDNPNDVLTLDNLYIDTDDEYGLKVPDNCTVVLKGINRIKASKAALYLGGDVTFKGSGTLILEGGEYGILCNSTDKRSKASFISGKYEITAKDCGIFSAVMLISLSSADFTVTAENYSIYGQTVSLTNGLKYTASSPVFANTALSVEACDVCISSNDNALISNGSFKIDYVSISAGESISSVKSVENYSGEKCIKTVSTWKDFKSSFLFGENVSVVYDVLIFAFGIVLVCAAIFVPKYLKKKKLQKIQSAQK